MRILFLHPSFPAQFRHVATAIAKDNRHQVVFGTTRREGSLPGVTKTLYHPSRESQPNTHHYVRSVETAVLQGQAVYRMAGQLKERGLVPDVVYGHSGWGPTLFIKDIFPQAQLLCYFEWFYHSRGSDADFDPDDPLMNDDRARIRMKNAPILTDLYSCDRGLSPTSWQHQQFPKEFHNKITVLHDGVNTDFFRPKLGAKLVLPSINLDLSQVDELVTYVTRGMEPYRGFPQFMEALALLQQRRPHCHAVIVGEDRVVYGKPLPDGKTYKQAMLEKLPLDLSRVHFTGNLSYEDYLKVLQASSVHVYLTRPFVLSWSMIESLSAGCLVVASNTAPVTEAIQDGVNGLLADFFSPEEIADRIEEALTHPDRLNAIRSKAREIVQQRYDLKHLLPQHLQWIQSDFAGNPVSLWTGRQSMPANSIARTVSPQQHAAIEPTSSDSSLAPIDLHDSKRKQKSKKRSPTQELMAIANSNGTSSSSQERLQPDLQAESLLDRPSPLDRFVYSLIRVRDRSIAQDLYIRLKEGKQTFAELASQYSQGREARTGGQIGPATLDRVHPKLAQLIRSSKPGQLSPPTQIEDVWVIVQL